MNRISRLLGKPPKAEFQWSKFIESDSVFLWEAFVTSTAKGAAHREDAEIAVASFKASLPDPSEENAIEEESVFSLVGAAALRAGWSENMKVLSQQCLVIKA